MTYTLIPTAEDDRLVIRRGDESIFTFASDDADAALATLNRLREGYVPEDGDDD